MIDKLRKAKAILDKLCKQADHNSENREYIKTKTREATADSLTELYCIIAECVNELRPNETQAEAA